MCRSVIAFVLSSQNPRVSSQLDRFCRLRVVHVDREFFGQIELAGTQLYSPAHLLLARRLRGQAPEWIVDGSQIWRSREIRPEVANEVEPVLLPLIVPTGALPFVPRHRLHSGIDS